MSNIDDWLNSLAVPAALQPDTAPSLGVLSQRVEEELLHTNAETPPPPLSSEPISPDNFDAILADNGFNEPEYEEAEEVEDDESQGEVRDLDAEEDTEWEMREVAGVMTPVQRLQEETVHVSVGDQEANVPVITESAQDEATVPAVSPAVPEPLIPPNSPTLLIDDSTSRFSGTEWYHEIQNKRIILAGLGGIGSWCTLQLARMNPTAIFLYDDDVVETANMSGQLYSRNDVGKHKVNAMADMIGSYTNMGNVFAIPDRFTGSSEAGDIMMCGFDNMEARKTFFYAWKHHVLSKPKSERSQCVFLDGRLSIDTLQVFCISGDDEYSQERYSFNYLFTDAQAEETVCSMKQTTYLACMIGSVMVNLFTNWVANSLNPVIPFDLPFFTEYDAQNMIFKTVK